MKISILGATGSIGAPTAFYIAASGLADELLMVGGKRQNLLEHHAVDISEAVSTTNCRVSHGGYEDLTGSDIVINAAGAHLPLHLERRLRVQKQAEFARDIALEINKRCPNSVVITAINPIDATNYASFLTGGFDRMQLIGYSINDTIRYRKSLAQTLKENVNRVECIVIGEHGGTQVPLFSSAKVDGKPIQISEEMRQRIRAGMWGTIKKFEALDAGRTAGWTCAVGLTTLVRAMVEDSDLVFPCSVVLKGEYGLNDLSMGVPVKLGPSGVRDILEYNLSRDEQAGLKKTAETLISDAAIVRETLKTG
jgi:malate/lactate dehydrogenase